MKTAPEITVTTANTKVAEAFDMSPAEVAVIKESTAKGTTDTELAYFIGVCKSMGLNPFNKEVWCYKDKSKNLLIFAGRDGFLSKAQKNPTFNGIRSVEVCENDEIEIDIPLGHVHHKIDPRKERGKIIGAYSIVFRKEGEPTIEWADFKTYNKGYNAWKTHPADMIKKVAECHALKKAFGISGIQSEYDFDTNNGVATPIDTTEVVEMKTPIDDLRGQIRQALETYQGEDVEEIRAMCALKYNQGEFTEEFAKNVLDQIS